MSYEATKIEKKWQTKWKKTKLHEVDLKKTSKDKKYYNLVMFPYPSGDKLHIGHWYAYAPPDSHGRFMRMHGYDVFEPIGFDSFGLPAENYAIKTGVHPKDSIAKNVDYMIKQISAIGGMHDWGKTLSTSSPCWIISAWNADSRRWRLSIFFIPNAMRPSPSPSNSPSSCPIPSPGICPKPTLAITGRLRDPTPIGKKSAAAPLRRDRKLF